MSETEQRNFGQLLAYHTAPTLLGIKCASLVSLSRREYDVDEHSCYFNRKTAARGLKSRVLCGCRGRVLLMVSIRGLPRHLTWQGLAMPTYHSVGD